MKYSKRNEVDRRTRRIPNRPSVRAGFGHMQHVIQFSTDLDSRVRRCRISFYSAPSTSQLSPENQFAVCRRRPGGTSPGSTLYNDFPRRSWQAKVNAAASPAAYINERYDKCAIVLIADDNIALMALCRRELRSSDT